jgi:hypothetical protein
MRAWSGVCPGPRVRDLDGGAPAELGVRCARAQRRHVADTAPHLQAFLAVLRSSFLVGRQPHGEQVAETPIAEPATFRR